MTVSFFLPANLLLLLENLPFAVTGDGADEEMGSVKVYSTAFEDRVVDHDGEGSLNAASLPPWQSSKGFEEHPEQLAMAAPAWPPRENAYDRSRNSRLNGRADGSGRRVPFRCQCYLCHGDHVWGDCPVTAHVPRRVLIELISLHTYALSPGGHCCCPQHC